MKEMFNRYEVIGISYQVNGEFVHEDPEVIFNDDDGIRIVTPNKVFVVDALADGEQSDMTKRYKVFESDSEVFVHFY